MAGNPLAFVATNTLKPGALDAERARVRDLVAFIDREEPQLLGFHEYVNADATVAIQVYGPVDDEMLDELRTQAGAGVRLTVAREHLGGLTRP